jgi:hypothetical protein
MLTRRIPTVLFALSFWIESAMFVGACAPAADPGTSGTGGSPVSPDPAQRGSGGTSGSAAPSAGSGGSTPSMAAGGAVGQPGGAGSGGAVGAGGAADAEASGIDTAAPEPAPDAGPAGPAETPMSYACNLVLGIKQTGEWFTAGFESIVENARWEVVPVHNGHIELWADPKNGIWAEKPQSPCAPATSPDRVIFVGTNYDYTTVEEFLPKYVAVIENIKAKFAGVKRIELQTHVRAPGNVACPGALDFKTTIKPAQDQALEMAVAKYPGLVVASPKFEVSACADYGLYPHFKGTGAATVAKRIGEHYKAH